MRIREPAVAGTFYASDPVALQEGIDRWLAAVPDGHEQPAAVIAPHAGHIYSGPVAAHAYRTLHTTRRIVLAGPAHYVPVRGLVGPRTQAWRTPLGLVEIDEPALDELAVQRDDVPHAPEHSLEVHIPFLQSVLQPGWTLVPLLVGRATPAEVADLLEPFLDDPESTVVLSTDLSHYHPYAVAVAQDRQTAARIVSRRWREIADDDACGAYPLRGLLLAADRLGLPVQQLDLRNSGDTAGPRDRVVGYGAFRLGP
jgi:AmmeMemoRadiSam system protein B